VKLNLHVYRQQTSRKFSLEHIIDLLILNKFLINFLSDTYPLSKTCINILCWILPLIFAFFLHRYRWVGFLLGIISFTLIAFMGSILECAIPNGQCSHENLEEGTFQIFMIIGSFYSLVILIIGSILKSS
jgi:hypothetical protein